jgi:hypothetical protein
MSTKPSRPLLLAQNRKLRHLKGVYIRNLSFVRPKGRTADDAALNKSPTKLEALRETPQLHHARSSESLPSLRPKQPRRRSTNLAHASPLTRQRKLEYAIDSRVADAFFSLHCEGEEEPIYISETIEHSTVCLTASIPPYMYFAGALLDGASRISTSVFSTSQTIGPASLDPPS